MVETATGTLISLLPVRAGWGTYCCYPLLGSFYAEYLVECRPMYPNEVFKSQENYSRRLIYTLNPFKASGLGRKPAETTCGHRRYEV